MQFSNFVARGAVMALALSCGLTACTTVPSGDPYWGRDAHAAPGWARIKHAAVDAARSPFTWAPALGALASQIGDVDNEITKEAMDHTPIFGSMNRAKDASDVLLGVSSLCYGVSGALAPYGEGEPALRTKVKGFAVGLAALGTAEGFTAGLKSATQRQRPNGDDDRSLPSGHADAAALAARLSQRNLEYFDLASAPHAALNAGLGMVAAGTAWARVEAGEHHFSDVLVGAALGNFFGIFFNDAFLGRAGSGRGGADTAGVQMGFEVSRDRLITRVRWRK